jgi:tetratricopeptide (TPR) repeat protein
LLKPAMPLPAQSRETGSLAAEIGNAENLPKDPAEKHEALLRLARLFQLSGNLERAAAAWLEAAGAAPGGRDDRALLEGARILIALGEYEKAEEGIRAALAGGREKIRAAYLAALLGAFRSGEEGALARVAEDPDFAPYRSEIYYTLWKISSNGRWKTMLLEEFPQSPEGMIARDAEGVHAAATAHWLLFPGRDSPPAAAPEAARPAAAPAPAVPAAARPVPAVPASAAPAPAAQPPADASGAFLQTGLYGREENAAAMARRLKEAGFDARLRRRTVNGTGYWAVSVPPGPDMNGTIRTLKEAGFDSFPVYE